MPSGSAGPVERILACCATPDLAQRLDGLVGTLLPVRVLHANRPTWPTLWSRPYLIPQSAQYSQGPGRIESVVT